MNGQTQPDYGELVSKYGGTIIGPNGATPPAAPAAATPTAAAQPAAAGQYDDLVKQYGGTIIGPGAQQVQQQQATQQTQQPVTPEDPNQGYVHKALQWLSDMHDKADVALAEGQVESGKGVIKSGLTALSHIVNMVHSGYGGDLTDVPQYMRDHPGITAKQAWDAVRGIGPNGEQIEPDVPDNIKQQRDALKKAGDWLAEKGKLKPYDQPGGWAQHAGAFGGDILQYLGLEGAVALGAKAGETPALAADVGGMATEALSTAQKYERAATVGKIFQQYPVLGKAASIGTRVMHLVGDAGDLTDPIVQQSIVGGTQSGIQSEGDPREMTKGALIAGGFTGMAQEASEMASSFLKRMGEPEAAAMVEGGGADTTGALAPPRPLPERPVKPKAAPVPVEGQAPTRPEPLPPVEHPPAPERPAPIPRPAPPEPTPIPEQPQAPEPPESTPLPDEPVYPGLYDAERAPVEQRLADMESELSRGVVGDSSTVAAQHLENINDTIKHEDFKNLPPAQQQQIQSQRRSLAQYVSRGVPPPDSDEFINQAGDFQTAADMMRQPGSQARARWNTLSGGQYETLQSQLDGLEGKVDQASIAKRGDIEREMNKLVTQPKFMGSASPERRALYSSMAQQADVVEGAGKTIDGAFAGADRTGDFNPKSLQTNWRNYVNKYGVEQVKDALGEERFNSMNDFVNQVVAEPKVDAAHQALTDALHDSAVSGWKAQVAEIKARDKAATDAQTEQFNQVLDDWKQQKAQAAETDKTAKADQTAEWAQAKIQQAADFKETTRQYKAGVAARNVERQQLLANRAAEYRAQAADYQQAKIDAKNATAEQKQKIDDDHAQAMDAWKQETTRIKNLNMADKADYQNLQKAKKDLGDQQESRMEGLFSKLPKGKLGYVLAMAGASLPEAAMLAMQHGMSGTTGLAIAGGGLAAYGLKRLLVNPTAARLAVQAIREGGNPQIYGPAIAELLRNTTNTAPQPGQLPTEQEAQRRQSSYMVDQNPKGLIEPGNLNIRNRPTIENDDGSHSSELSFSREENGKEVLVPSIVNGRFMTPDGKMPPMGHEVDGKYVPTPEEQAMYDRAWQHYRETGEHLGKFDTPDHADAYAERLHNRGEQ